MEFEISSAKLTGSPGPSGWAQVYDFKPEEAEKLETRGHFFAVLSTSNQEEGVESVSQGREILTRLHEEYFGNTQATAFNALQNAVEKIMAEFSSSGEKIQIVATSFVKGVVYSAVGGGASAVLFRSQRLARILVSQKKETVSASGYPQDGDFFLLGTSSFFDIFADGVIKAALESGSLDKAVESFAPTIHSAKDTGSLGAVIVAFGKKRKEGLADLSDRKKEKEVEKEKKKSLSGPRSFRLKTAGWLGKIIEKLPVRKIYIRKNIDDLEGVRSRRTALSAGAILLLLLLISIGFGIKQKRDKDFRSKYQSRLIEADHLFEESLKLITLNPSRSRELFLESQNLTSQLLGEEIEDKALDELKVKLDQNEGRILGEYQSSIELFIDLSLVSDGFEADAMVSSNERMIVTDRNSRKIVSVYLETKKTEVVVGPDKLDDFQGAAVYADRVFVLKDDGIYEVDSQVEKVIDKEWEGEALIHAYAANFYILDRTDSKIYRYAGTGSGFGSRKDWLASGIEPDFSGEVSWAIDGSLWLADNIGRVTRFLQGAQKAFSVKGVTPELIGQILIYTNEELNYLYLLDKANSRVIVLDKEGEFKAQYVAEEIGEAKGLTVSEMEEKIVILGQGSKLYSIELKHLKEGEE